MLVKAFEEIAKSNPGDVDGLWRALEGVASRFHSLRAMTTLNLVGRTGTAKMQRHEPRARTGDASQVLLDRCGRRVRRLTELCRRWPVGAAPISQHARNMRKVLADAESWHSPWRAAFLTLNDGASLARLMAQAEEEFRVQVECTRQDRRDRWHTWCSESLRVHNGKLWRWIKEGPRPVVCHKVPLPPQVAQPAVVLPDLPAGASPQDYRIRQVERWWWDLWRPGAPAVVNVGPWLASLSLTPFPALGVLSGSELMGVIKRTRRLARMVGVIRN